MGIELGTPTLDSSIGLHSDIDLPDLRLPRALSMREVLEALGEGYEWYRIRRIEYNTDQKIPFRVSPEALYLSSAESNEVTRIGTDVVDFMYAADELYRREFDVKDLLDRGKPKIFQEAEKPRYLFVRPDLLITKQGFSICEIETSPFWSGSSRIIE